ncbi:BatA domain-containing protein, partial [Candidatus Hydrogenedentota bacterium]
MNALVSSITGFFTANFMTPAFFAFLGLIPIVVLLYLLKLRRTQVIISSTMLWIKSLDDLTANAPFQRLRKNLLLFLQILILLLVVTGLARPFVRSDYARAK